VNNRPAKTLASLASERLANPG